MRKRKMKLWRGGRKAKGEGQQQQQGDAVQHTERGKGSRAEGIPVAPMRRVARRAAVVVEGFLLLVGRHGAKARRCGGRVSRGELTTSRGATGRLAARFDAQVGVGGYGWQGAEKAERLGLGQDEAVVDRTVVATDILLQCPTRLGISHDAATMQPLPPRLLPPRYPPASP
jgi:hypothetical protein